MALAKALLSDCCRVLTLSRLNRLPVGTSLGEQAVLVQRQLTHTYHTVRLALTLKMTKLLLGLLTCPNYVTTLSLTLIYPSRLSQKSTSGSQLRSLGEISWALSTSSLRI